MTLLLRHSLRYRTSLIALLVMALVVLLPAAAFGQEGVPPDHKVEICHATNSTTNPYVLQEVARNAAAEGHDEHEGGIFDPETVEGEWGDIIPPFTYTHGGAEETYPGKNWPAGQEIMEQGCEFPVSVEPEVQPEVEVTLAKDWTGDTGGLALEILDVTFTLGEQGAFQPGDTLTVDPDTTLTVIDETVDGLPETCSFDATGLTHETAALDAWTANEKAAARRTETFTITNDVDCAEVLDEDDEQVTVTLVKHWNVVADDDGHFDESDVGVTFTADGETVTDGSFDAAPGDEVTITETVTGFPEACTYDAIGFEDGAYTHTVGDADETLDIVNDVDCAEVQGVEIVEPQPAGGGEPVDEDQPVDGDQPMGGAQPEDEDQPMGGAQPEDEDQPVDGDQPMGGAQPVGGDEPVDEDQPADGDQPMGGAQPEATEDNEDNEDETEVLGVALEADDEDAHEHRHEHEAGGATDEVEVLGVTQERAAADELPRTGATTTEMLAAAILALLIGAGLLLATRRETAPAEGLTSTTGPSIGASPRLWTMHRAVRPGVSRETRRLARGHGLGGSTPG